MNKPPSKLDRLREMRERQFASARPTARLITPELKNIVAAASPARRPKKKERKR